MQNKLVRWLAYIALSILLSPIILFNSGLLLVGEYEGENGFIGFLGTIYGNALTGSLSAWIVILGPILLVLIWLAVMRVWRTLPAAVETPKQA